MVLDTPSLGLSSFDFILTAEHTIDITQGEDPGTAGFTGWTPQWELRGSATQVPYSLGNPPTVNVGALTPTTGLSFSDDGRVTKDEVISVLAYPEDTGKTIDINGDRTNDDISNFCVGSCWDYTVTGAADATVQVTLPLSAEIPGNAVFRKYNGTAWVDFDTSTGDLVESAPGALADCTTPGAYTSGLTAGNFCVRLTITENSPNDLDGTPSNGVIIDPSGVAEVSIATVIRSGQSIGDADGCSMSNKSINPRERADWWIVAAFLMLLGVRKIYTSTKQI